MKLVYEASKKLVKVGDKVTLARGGEKAKVAWFMPPHTSESEGKVTVYLVKSGHTQEFYVSIIGAVWVEREDRGYGLPDLQDEAVRVAESQMQSFFVVTNKKNTEFFAEGTGNSEYDPDTVQEGLNNATLYAGKGNAEYILKQPKTKKYWGSSDLAKFMKTAVVKKVLVKIVEDN